MKRRLVGRVRRALCSSLRVPAFVPPVLVLINIYLILWGQQCPGDTAKQNGKRSVETSHEESLEEIKEEHQNRLKVVKTVCDIYNQDPDFRNMELLGEAYTTPSKGLVFCDIPKVGCTFWKRILRFINKDYEGSYHSPFEIPRIYTHFGPYNNTKIFKLSNSSSINEISSGYTFMYSRDPYARLWSGYLDKFILPDFWWWLGTKIIKEYRPNASPLSAKCGYDVTFEEFLKQTTGNLKQGKHVDKHFRPIYQLCSPCHVRFDVIGKQETFASDAKVILESNDLSKIGKQNTIIDKDLEEIRMLVNYNFDIQTRLTLLGKNHECYNQVDIAHRLWKTFQYNGYIGEDLEFPESEMSQYTSVTEVKRAMLDTLIAIRRTTKPEVIKKWKEQRRKYFLEAYRHVSEEVIEDIIEAYALDFELFQYEKRPDYIIP